MSAPWRRRPASCPSGVRPGSAVQLRLPLGKLWDLCKREDTLVHVAVASDDDGAKKSVCCSRDRPTPARLTFEENARKQAAEIAEEQQRKHEIYLKQEADLKKQKAIKNNGCSQFLSTMWKKYIKNNGFS